MAIQKLGQSTLEITQDNFNLILPPAMQLLKKNNRQLSMGNGEGGWGAEWTVTSSTNECMGAIIEENVHSYKQSNQEYENIW